MIRLVIAMTALATAIEASNDLQVLPVNSRTLKRTGGNPQRATNFASWYANNISPDTFTQDSGSSPSGAASNDFELACNNGDLEENLYGSFSQYADCMCDPTTLTISCAYGDPVCESSTYCTQEYYYWSFDGISGQFSNVGRCVLCESGDCVDDTSVYDGYCGFMGFYGLQQPSLCLATFASNGFAAVCNLYTDCQVCTTSEGFYGYAPTAYGSCFTLDDVPSGCFGDPYFHNPFLALQSKDESKSKVLAIVLSIVGFLLFIGIGVGVYYVLHEGVPERCLCKKKHEEAARPNDAAKQLQHDDTEFDTPEELPNSN